jgi:hypothetical protein
MTYDGRSQFKVHTDERTQVHSARLSLAVTHPSINRGRRALNFNERATELALVATAPLRTRGRIYTRTCFINGIE